MRLDTPTLFAMTVAVALTAGLLFLLSWNHTRRTRALLIWGVAHLGGAAASALLCLRTVIPDSLSIGLANTLMITAYGLIWSGMRSFEGRRPVYAAALAGGALWAAACLVPAFYASLPARIVLASGLGGLYCALGALECRRGMAEPLASRPVTTVLLCTYAALYWVRVPLALLAPPAEIGVLDSPWMPVLCFSATLFTVALAFLFMALTKERAEREQRLAAETDALTGIANRRAFVARAQALLDTPSRPVALLLFDLDHFKAINDTYGHSVGDGVLAAFCALTQALLPERAGLGRLGGEEFACAVPDCDAREAARIAEAVRGGVAHFRAPAYPLLKMRVSVGVAIRHPGETAGFDEVMRRADEALYRAKRRGRDRVELAPAPAALAPDRSGGAGCWQRAGRASHRTRPGLGSRPVEHVRPGRTIP